MLHTNLPAEGKENVVVFTGTQKGVCVVCSVSEHCQKKVDNYNCERTVLGHHLDVHYLSIQFHRIEASIPKSRAEKCIRILVFLEWKKDPRRCIFRNTGIFPYTQREWWLYLARRGMERRVKGWDNEY